MSLRLAIPSNGALAKGSLEFLASCGLGIKRANSRQYTGVMPSLPGVSVMFQRQSDITSELDDESADMGISGLDRYRESRLEIGCVCPLIDDAGFGYARLVIAVPASWVDVVSIDDLGELALEFREARKPLRIATKFERLVRRFLYDRGINHFTIVHVAGALEAAPLMGYADLIADVSATGVTLKENQLRPLENATVIESQAAVIGNLQTIAADRDKLNLAREMLERMEARLRARKVARVGANVTGGSVEEVAGKVFCGDAFKDIRGPTISRVVRRKSVEWYEVRAIVRSSYVIKAVDHLRKVGADSISVENLDFLFGSFSKAYERLIKGAMECMKGVNLDSQSNETYTRLKMEQDKQGFTDSSRPHDQV